MSPASSFYADRGRIYWGASGHPSEIGIKQAESLRGLYRDEFRAAWKAHDHAAATRVAVLLLELNTALREAMNYARKINQGGTH